MTRPREVRSSLTTLTATIDKELRSLFGPGTTWKPNQGPETAVWPLDPFDVVWVPATEREATLRSIWRTRFGGGATPVIVMAMSEQADKVRIIGPQDGRAPIRTVPAGAALRLLDFARTRPRRESAALLAAEFVRLDESGIPGIGVKGLLTAHFLKERLPKQPRWPQLQQIATRVAPGRSWQEMLRALGWQMQQTDRGYVLRAGAEPVAVVHVYSDTTLFSHATPQGSLPEGLALADCARQGAAWAILAAPQRFRLFQFSPPVGAATGQYLEIDLAELEQRAYASLLAPDALKRGGWFEAWLTESQRFGDELREGLEERLRLQALPHIAQGLGEFLEREERANLTDRMVLERIEEAALTLIFRFIFVLYAEATGHLPIASEAYRPHGASELAADARRDVARLDARSTRFLDRFNTLVRMVRQGDAAVGVPAYNGSLFAPSGFPGGELLERAKVKDTYLAPALAAIFFDNDGPDPVGVDFAQLQIGHLGAIYEGLLGLKLTCAREPMRYDEKNDHYLPARAGDKAIVQKAELFYQTEAGGRKAGGVFYTRHEFVRHLLQHSLAPALDAHLDEIARLAKTDPDAALRRLFDFSVVDPAMGSAHFLTAALDMMADRIATRFLTESPLPGLRGLLDTLKDADGTAGPGRVYEDNALLRRLILKRCIYGVDLSPMAVEVANISLWLHSFVPGLSLAYLGSNLKVGDALIGLADLAALRATSPMFTARGTNSPIDQALTKAEAIARALAAIPDRTPEEVKRSQEKQRELEQVTAGLARCLDLWCAEPLGVKGARWALDMGTVEAVMAGNPARQAAGLLKQAQEEATRRRFFHWPLAFPLAFLRERPGFDVVVGNPPWNEVNLEELAFYALRDPGIRGLA